MKMSLATPVAVALKKDPTKLGFMVEIITIVMNNELIIKSAVVWDDVTMRTPCPSFHRPEDLVSLGCPMVDALFDDEEEEEETEPEATEPEATEAEPEAEETEAEGEALN
jgi:hypothetical protein